MNAITVDVEDWAQAGLDAKLPLTDRFQKNTRLVLELFADHGVRATFFVLGLAAEKAPGLLREIVASGHELQCHGYGHDLLHDLSRHEFRADIDRSKKLLEDITGVAVVGYRAPAFSITRKTMWALEILAESGFTYDSSIFPVETSRYGIRGAPWFPYRLRTPAGHELIEVPVASLRWARRTWPTGGGGWFRLFPYAAIRRGVKQINEAGKPATVYFHPHEFDAGEFSELPFHVPWTRRLHQGLGRRTVPGKIRRLLADFTFGRVCDMIASAKSLPLIPDAQDDTIHARLDARPRVIDLSRA